MQESPTYGYVRREPSSGYQRQVHNVLQPERSVHSVFCSGEHVHQRVSQTGKFILIDSGLSNYFVELQRLRPINRISQHHQIPNRRNEGLQLLHWPRTQNRVSSWLLDWRVCSDRAGQQVGEKRQGEIQTQSCGQS